MIQPDVLRSSLHKKSEELLVKGMIKLGILSGNYKKIIKKQKHNYIILMVLVIGWV